MPNKETRRCHVAANGFRSGAHFDRLCTSLGVGLCSRDGRKAGLESIHGEMSLYTLQASPYAGKRESCFINLELSAEVGFSCRMIMIRPVPVLLRNAVTMVTFESSESLCL